MVHGTARLLLMAVAMLALASYAHGVRSPEGTTRRYYIAANKVAWNYTPSGRNQCQGREFTPQDKIYTRGGTNTTYLKAQFQPYSDASFTSKLARPAEEEHLGIMGPLLRAVVGDVVQVHLRNNLDFPINMVPQGVTYSSHQAVKVAPPGGTIVYAWSVPEQAGPAPESNITSAMWLYRSLTDQQAHADAGLFGPLIVTRRADADPITAKPRDLDAEFVTVYQVVDEEGSPYAAENAKQFGGDDGQNGIADSKFAASQLKHSVNGRLFCNLDGLRSSVDSAVRWHTTVQGNKINVHNIHWHGLVFVRDGIHTDQFIVLPSKTWTADMITDNPGTWMVHCHVNAHYPKGMQAQFTLDGESQTSFDFTGVQRQYYIQSEETAWNYAKSGGDMCSGRKMPFDSTALLSLGKSDSRIGPVSIKARYVEYTDATFTKVRVRTDAERHLGLLGPVIRAAVGDKVKIMFRNACRFPTTIHVHGLKFNKNDEGSGSNDGTSGASKSDDGISTGGTHEYSYVIPERAGPGPKERSSKVWMYHSYADQAADTSAGLMGPIIVSRRGASRPDGTPADVDREYVMFFSVVDESASSLFVANVNTYLGKNIVSARGLPELRLGGKAQANNNNKQRAPVSVADAAAAADLPKLADLLGNEGFRASNLKHSINGFMFCNMPGLDAKVGQRARFYTMALGSDVDLHTPNLESASMDWQGRNQNSMMLLPGSMETADVKLAASGSWMFQCRVAEHLADGMRAKFTVRPAEDPTLGELGPTNKATLQAALRSSKQAARLPSSTAYLFAGTESLPSLASVAADTPKGEPIAAPVARTSYIQAQEQVWNYAPHGLNRCTGKKFAGKSALYTKQMKNTLGPRAIKALYRGYTDATFSTPLRHNRKLGILGPLIQAQVGDTIRIVFRNKLPFGANLYLGGAIIQQDSSAPNTTVDPGTTIDYLWQVPKDAGPKAEDPSSVHYPYFSTVNYVTDEYNGLIGVVMIARQGTLTAQGTIPGTDLVQPLLFQVWDESESAYLTKNTAQYNPFVDTGHPDFKEGNLKHAINGYVYCNMPDIYVKQGRTVRFLQLAAGTDTDMHAPVFNNQVLVVDHVHTAATMLFPGVTRTADMVAASAPGIFQYRCDFQNQYEAGMQARLVVTA